MNLVLGVIGLISFLVTVIVVPLRLSKVLKNQINLDKKLDIISKNQGVIEKKIK
jgi:hypothetical protein